MVKQIRCDTCSQKPYKMKISFRKFHFSIPNRSVHGLLAYVFCKTSAIAASPPIAIPMIQFLQKTMELKVLSTKLYQVAPNFTLIALNQLKRECGTLKHYMSHPQVKARRPQLHLDAKFHNILPGGGYFQYLVV